MTSPGSFLEEIFSKLDMARVSYCVLRNYDGLPDRVEHDVDLIVHQEHLTSFRRILHEVCLSRDWGVVRTVDRSSFHSWYLVDLGEPFSPLHIDVWTQIDWKGVVYADGKVILGTRGCHKGFWIASAGSEAAVSLLKEYLQFGVIKDKGAGKTKARIAHLAREDPRNFLSTLQPCLGVTMSRLLLECARTSDWVRLEETAKKVRRDLIIRALRRRPLCQVRDWLSFLWGHFSDRVLHPSGLFVCLIGPDGAGKSTVSRDLHRELSTLFTETHYYHGHWGILPELKCFQRIIAKLLSLGDKAIQPKYTADKPAPSSFGLFRALIYVSYYSVDYVLGYMRLFRAKGSGELVLFDRYYYDYMIQSNYSRLPRWLLRAIKSLLPQPDMLFFLRNKPEVIHQRKQELSVSQIREQIRVCKQIVKGQTRGAHVIWTNGSPEITSSLVRRRIVEFMTDKVTTRQNARQ